LASSQERANLKRQVGGQNDGGSNGMADLVFGAATVAFFVGCWLYVKACDRI
jgi:hypothetical protein